MEGGPKIENMTTLNQYAKKQRELDIKPNNLICQRCYELKHLHQRVAYENPKETAPG
jgi:hypothetical protein